MKRQILKNSILTLLILILTVTVVNAQEDTTSNEGSKMTLYVLNTCPYCEELLLELEQEEALEIVLIKESSKDPNRSELLEIANECNMRAAVPLLYDGERCYQGRYTARDKIFDEAGIDVSVYSVDPSENYTSQLDEEISEPGSDDNLLERDNEDIKRESPTSDQEEDELSADQESNILGDRLSDESDPIERTLPEIPTINIAVSLLAPLVLVLLGYLIINKMKV